MSKARRKGIPFVVAAPSGTGKTTVCRAILDRDDSIESSISHTTRRPRAGERDGVHYHFVSAAEFRRLVEQGAFVEHAEYSGQNYGTSKEALRGPIEDRGHDVLVEIEVQGAAQIRERRRDARFIFLLPPDMRELERRLRDRGTDSDEQIDRRLAQADIELRAHPHFDYAVVNDDLEPTLAALLEIIAAEREASDAAREEVLRKYGRARVYREWCSRNAREGAD